jgi:hypothetical protein
VSPSLDALPATLAAVVDELESLCVASERALMAKEWDELARVLDEHRRVTQAIANELALVELAPEPDVALQRRLRRVHAVRADQLLRLARFRESLASRLATVARLNSMRRSLGAPEARLGIGRLDTLQ